MKNICYRKLNKSDMDEFIKLRLEQLREEANGRETNPELKSFIENYLKYHINDGSFISWIAIDNNFIVGTSGLSIVEKPPYNENLTGKIGLLSCMYTKVEYRRKGIAKQLLTYIVSEAKECGCGTIQITASNMGILLYSNYGFEKNDHFMQYKLT